MKVLQSQQTLLKNIIRNGMAANPLVSIRRMQEIVKVNSGRSISDKYVSRLMEETRSEAVLEADTKTLTVRLAEVRERYRLLIQDLNHVIYWSPEGPDPFGVKRPSLKDRLAAMKMQAQLETALFKTELCAGLFRAGNASVEMREQRTLIVRRQKGTTQPASYALPRP